VNGGPVQAGRLELDRRALRLAGAASETGAIDEPIPYADLAEAQIERWGPSRLCGRPALVLACRGGTRVRIASLEGAGSLHELADRLESARRQATA